MPLTEEELHLAENCFGYGRWDAPCWFIGLEEGQAPWEKNDFRRRSEIFSKLNEKDDDGLTDCREFHDGIGEKRWHEKNPKTGEVDLQSTWKYLVPALFAGKDYTSVDLLRDDLKGVYQSDRWGTKDNATGETCVIDLSGLPANNSNASKNCPQDVRAQLDAMRPRRIERIRRELRGNLTNRYVVMYGLTEKKNWERIAGRPLEEGVPTRVGLTTFIVARHPIAYYAKGTRKDRFWINVGKTLLAESYR